MTLLLDPNYPSRLFGGKVSVRNHLGGAFVSTNDGAAFTSIGLNGITVGSLSLNGNSTTVYAASYASGIYISRIPADAFPR